jgi:hypothetical protein
MECIPWYRKAHGHICSWYQARPRPVHVPTPFSPLGGEGVWTWTRRGLAWGLEPSGPGTWYPPPRLAKHVQNMKEKYIDSTRFLQPQNLSHSFDGFSARGRFT